MARVEEISYMQKQICCYFGYSFLLVFSILFVPMVQLVFHPLRQVLQVMLHSSHEQISYLGIFFSLLIGIALFLHYKWYYQFLFNNDPFLKGPFSKKDMKLEKMEIFYRMSLVAVVQLELLTYFSFSLILICFSCARICHHFVFRISQYDSSLKKYCASLFLFQLQMQFLISANWIGL